MPTLGENQPWKIDVQDAAPAVKAIRRRPRGRSAAVSETTMVFRTTGDSSTRVRTQNASSLRISITGPKPGEEEDEMGGFEATAFGRSTYNTRTSVSITHHDANAALDHANPRSLVRLVSVGPISEEDVEHHPVSDSDPFYIVPIALESDAPGTRPWGKVNVRPVSAPPVPPSAAVVKAIRAAPSYRPAPPSEPAPSQPGPSRPTAPLRIITQPLATQSNAGADSDVDSPLSSSSPTIPSFRPQFGGSARDLRRIALDEPLPSLCPSTPSASSLLDGFIPEQEEDDDEREYRPSVRSPSCDSLHNSAEHSVESSVSAAGSVRSHASAGSSRPAVGLIKRVKLKLSGGNPRITSSSTLAFGRSSMTPPPSSFQRYECTFKELDAAARASSSSLGSRRSLRSSNSQATGKGVKEFLSKALHIGKDAGTNLKRAREEENLDPEEASQEDRPIAGRRTKRKLMGKSLGQ